MAAGLRAVTAAAVAVTVVAAAQASRVAVAPTAERVGARLVVAMEGTTPSAALLARIRAGAVGGVFVSGPNIASPTQLRGLTRELHAAAADAGRPPLLVYVDQEGGIVRRVPWAPPAIAAAGLATRPIQLAGATGRQTGEALRSLGVDVDLAPVADVPHSGAAFIAGQGRAYGTSPAKAGLRAAAFARGLAEGGVLATAKHFPGLGAATVSTDDAPVTIGGTRVDLDRDLLPFRVLLRAGVPLVMLSNASYTALDGRPAAWSASARRLLRLELGFEGATITDALEPLARGQGVTVETAALRSAAAGVDLLLLTGREAATERVHAALVARAAEIPTWTFTAAERRLAALRQLLGG